MRMTDSLGLTLREAPSDAQTVHHQLLVRAAYISPQQPARFTFLPLGEKWIGRLIVQIETAFSALAPQAMRTPTGFTPPSVLTEIVSRHVQSYKHLPRCLWHTLQEVRSEANAGLGLFSTLDAERVRFFALAKDETTAVQQYELLRQGLQTLLEGCQVPYIEGEGHLTGGWGDSFRPLECRSFSFAHPAGEDTFFTCPECAYRAQADVAAFAKRAQRDVDPLDMEKVATPDCKTIAALADFLEIPETSTAKAVFLVASIPDNRKAAARNGETFVFAILRGDMELNESKLAAALGAIALRPANDGEIRAAGAVPGYASPVKLQPRAAGSLPVITIVDDLIPACANLVGGANDEGYHFKNVNYGRDFTAQVVADIAACQAGYPCPQCGAALQAAPAVEIARLARLGARFGQEHGYLYQNEEGQEVPVEISAAEIDLERLIAGIVEANHDDSGLTLPAAVAPYDIHLIYLPDKKDARPLEEAERLYQAMENQGWRVLYDDRDERPGVKFNDADLIGLPLRLTVSARSLEGGGVECKPRTAADRQIVALSDILSYIRTAFAS